MARDALDSLLRVRRASEDEAKRAFAACLAEETLARQRAEAAEAAITREGEIAADLAGGDHAVEAYAAWLPVGQNEVLRTRAAHEQATANVVLARVTLTLAHAAAEAALTFLERRAAEEKAALAKRTQAILDEVKPPAVEAD